MLKLVILLVVIASVGLVQLHKQLQEELRLSQIRVLLLEATIDIADERFGTDMRKKVGARQS